MKSLKQLLDAKGYDVWSVGPDSPILEAVELMAERGVGALLVMNGDELVGIVSERDFARKVLRSETSWREMHVRDIMTPRVLYASMDETAEECLAVMTEKRIRHLPVVDEGRVVGVISIGDLVKEVISDQKFMIEQLINFIGM